MKDYEPIMSFGRDVAEECRDLKRGDETAAVAFLAKLANDGPALELAIGTGRIALPLADRGVRVDGIDISPAMVEQLRAQPGGREIAVTIGDLADVAVPGHYQLIYVVWNTLFNLLTQEDQVRCFKNVADHLTENGCFVIETYVPTFLHTLRNAQYVEVEDIQIDRVRLDVLRHDPTTQTIEESHISVTTDGLRFNPVVQRYAWPSEMDLMAKLAGLRLRERWGGWHGEPFNASSALHISVYGQ